MGFPHSLFAIAVVDHDLADHVARDEVFRLGVAHRGVDLVKEGDKNYVLDATIELSNNMAPKPAVGEFGAIGTRVGTVSVSGRLNTYFDDKELLARLIVFADYFDMCAIGPDRRHRSVDELLAGAHAAAERGWRSRLSTVEWWLGERT